MNTGNPMAPSGDVAPAALARDAAIGDVLVTLRDASLAHDDPVVPFDDVAAALRRWIESQTFAPARGEAGVQLVDAQAARFGRFDEVHVAGLVAGDWPESASRKAIAV